MSTTIPLKDAEGNLRKLIATLAVGDEIVLTDGNEVVARILGERAAAKPRPGPGLCQGMISIVAEDDEHLRDFAEYMP